VDSVEILIVGAGTTGLTLALQAHAHGARVLVIDRRAERSRPSRAMMMHPRTLEVLRPLRVAERMLARGDRSPVAELHLGARTTPVKLEHFDLPDTPFPHLLLISQAQVEAVLWEAVDERDIATDLGVELVALRSDVPGASPSVAVVNRGGVTEEIGFRYLVGCDGQASTVRSLTNIAWRGGAYRREIVLADLDLAGDLTPRHAHIAVDRRGLVFLFALGEQAPWRMLATRRASTSPPASPWPGHPVPTAELQGLIEAAGLPGEITRVAWSARVTLQHRLAARFQSGPVFLAGDAAHANSPAGGQGMNAGMQDAVNLGWKLAFAARTGRPGLESSPLLVSYERERRPADRRILAMTHVLFWAESGTGPTASAGRTLAAALGAAAIPLALRQRRLLGWGFRRLGQLHVRYRRSPLSIRSAPGRPRVPRPGERLADGTVSCEGRRVRLHELTATPGVHLLLARDAPRVDADALGGPDALGRPVALGEYVSVHRLSSWRGHGILAVRPDGYVGFRSTIVDQDTIRRWLTLLAPGTA
jgi:2-polyprenyl-6-methoxyphenol hydroxylase-like FAD-dependent oxidoreductase